MTSAINFYGASWCGDCVRSARLLDRLDVDYAHHDVEHDNTSKDKAIEISGKQSIPVITFGDGTFLVEPSDPQLQAKLLELGVIS